MEAFSSLVGQIYDTVVLPETWPAVLANLTDYMGAVRALLILEDALDPARSLFHLSFDDPEWIGRYLDRYMLMNPMRLATAANVEPGSVILTSDLMTPQEYGRSRFSSEFLATRDIVDLSVVILETTATTISVLSFARGREQGFADERVRRKLKLLGPHVRRAASIGHVLNRTSLEAASLADTLDKLDGAVLLLDDQGTILHSNRGFGRLLAEHGDRFPVQGNRLRPSGAEARGVGRLLAEHGDRFPVPGNRLRPSGAEARGALLAGVAKAGQGDAALGPDGVAIPFGNEGGKSWVGTLISLADGSRRSVGVRHRAVAALFIRELSPKLPVSTEALNALYGLTRREITIAAGIAEYGSVPATAAVLGIGAETVRTHLSAIFRKTGTGGQIELIKLLAGIANPFRS